ncbi:isoprenoid synthase domain-containing protein [Immersiella caudata]|uniref:Isoprenoid synthase domain-containing protein n=1 Tax=Immersiella caudata TaxID=314043 RepID=A0AA39T0H1_9PEZI|nr:isoprenoid synthase domain-containing protein [Immersiella caudata]
MAIEATDHFTPIARKLRGSVLRVPNLDSVYGRWKQGLNSHYDRLVMEINQQLDGCFQEERANAAKSMDFALLTCRSYPCADWPQLRGMGLFLVFLHLFDDEFDRKADTNVKDQASDLNLSNKYRLGMYHFVESALLNGAPNYNDIEKTLIGFAPVCNFFSAIVPALRDAPNISIPRFLKDLEFFMGPSNEEQHRLTLERRFPTVEQYDAFRLGTGAVDSICDLHQYVAGTNLPDAIARAPEVMTMRREASIQTCVCNDLLSLRKELNDMTLTSLIPIHLHESGASMDEIVGKLVQELSRSADAFDAAAKGLRTKAQGHGEGIALETGRFIEVFEGFQTGCFAFFSKSKRFGIADCQLPDGSFCIPL